MLNYIVFLPSDSTCGAMAMMATFTSFASSAENVWNDVSWLVYF